MPRILLMVLALATAATVSSCSTSTDGSGTSGAPGGSTAGASTSQPSGSLPSGSLPSGSQPSPGVQTSNWARPELAAAKAINGVRYKPEPEHDHTTGVVKYDTSPPTGGEHSPIWADCDGAVYSTQIANENAVHMLEHGAVWITYNPETLPAAELSALKDLVDGVNYLALSPYAGLRTQLSLQAWNYQLFLTSPSDPRLVEFIKVLKFPSSNTPEPGASCSGSGFVASESTPGHPYNG